MVIESAMVGSIELTVAKPSVSIQVPPAITSHELVSAVPNARHAGSFGWRLDGLQPAVGVPGVW